MFYLVGGWWVSGGPISGLGVGGWQVDGGPVEGQWLVVGGFVIHPVIVEVMYNIWTCYKTLSSKKATRWLKKYQSNDKLSWKVMFSSYQIE